MLDPLKHSFTQSREKTSALSSRLSLSVSMSHTSQSQLSFRLSLRLGGRILILQFSSSNSNVWQKVARTTAIKLLSCSPFIDLFKSILFKSAFTLEELNLPYFLRWLVNTSGLAAVWTCAATACAGGASQACETYAFGEVFEVELRDFFYQRPSVRSENDAHARLADECGQTNQSGASVLNVSNQPILPYHFSLQRLWAAGESDCVAQEWDENCFSHAHVCDLEQAAHWV